MPVLGAREALTFPKGDNTTDTVLGGIHFNTTILDRWDYTLYSNGTLSNDSWCMIVAEPYAPKLLLPNGTFINATWCFTPLNPIGARGKIGLGFAAAFGLAMVLCLINLNKHGRIYLPVEKRFWPIGRRWQWYWSIFACAAAFISLTTNVDVDRYYVLELPIVLNAFFWFLMQMGTTATVWEAVRHWASWMERQFIDPNHFALRQDDKRAKFEFWLPLVFYLWLWLNFFMVVPRNWGEIELQRSPDQSLQLAAPAATDARFKAAAVFLFLCWLTMAISLRHSIKHYRPRNRGLFNRAVGFVRFTPPRFMLLLPLSLALVAYQALCAWQFQWSLLNVHAENLPVFLGGYGPSLLILIIQIVAGFVNPNEDRELIRQRALRGEDVDRDLGIVRKPAWWRRLNVDHDPNERMRDRIARNVREIGGGRATARNIDSAIDTRAREAEAVEMGAMPRPGAGATDTAPSTTTPRPNVDASRPSPYTGKSDRRRSERARQTAAGLLFPNGAGAGSAVDRRAYISQDGPPPPYPDRGRPTEQRVESNTLRPPTAERSTSTGTSVSITAPPQQIRSMLDV